MTELTTQAATAADYAAILELNEAAVPAVNSIPESKLADLHRQATYLGAVRDDHGTIAGFLLALPETAEYESLNFNWFRRTYPQFVYIDRIVVDERYRRAGIGAMLYRDLARHLPAGCALLTCEVNLRPPNPASLAFHQRLGFEAVGEQDTEGGSKRVCLMARRLS